MVRISANREIGVQASLDGSVVENSDLVKTGAATGENATKYVARVHAHSTGKTSAAGNTLKVDGAKENRLLSIRRNEFR